MNEAALVSLATTFNNAVAGVETAYGLLPADIVTSTADTTAFSTSITDASITKAAALSSTQAKVEKKDVLVSELSKLFKKVYATPTVTDAMLVTAGLAPRNTPKVKIVPQVPVAFLATPSVNGTVSFAWSKGANRYGVSYIIEQKNDDGGWVMIYSTTKQKATLPNFAVGTTASFRVRASHNNLFSAPSNEFTIYPAGVGFAGLKLAA